MKINWRVRLQSPQFWIGLIGVIMSPIMSYLGLTGSDLTSWGSVLDVIKSFVSNPYLISTVLTSALAFVGVITDPTTKGIRDSEDALEYTRRREREIMEKVEKELEEIGEEKSKDKEV